MGPISPADNVEVTLEASATSVVVEFVYEPSSLRSSIVRH